MRRYSKKRDLVQPEYDDIILNAVMSISSVL